MAESGIEYSGPAYGGCLYWGLADGRCDLRMRGRGRVWRCEFVSVTDGFMSEMVGIIAGPLKLMMHSSAANGGFRRGLRALCRGKDHSLRILSLFRRIGPMERENGTDAARDRVLLLLGLAGGLRLSELSALLVEDLTFVERGTVILIRHSKTH
jgi:hypothetical protein